MTSAAATTLGALLLFAAFHVPMVRRGEKGWTVTTLHGRPAMLCGIGYHLLLLPAVAALPAPDWAVAAGYAWMFLDVMLDAAALTDTAIDARSLRDGVHVISTVWLLGAGWAGGPVLGILGTALSAAFLTRLACAATRTRLPRRLLHVNAALNVLWIAGVAVALW